MLPLRARQQSEQLSLMHVGVRLFPQVFYRKIGGPAATFYDNCSSLEVSTVAFFEKPATVIKSSVHCRSHDVFFKLRFEHFNENTEQV